MGHLQPYSWHLDLDLVQLGHHPSCNSVQQLVINGQRFLACYWKALVPNRQCKCWWQEKKKVDIMSVCSDFSQVMDSLWVTKEKTSTLLPPQTGFFSPKKSFLKSPSCKKMHAERTQVQWHSACYLIVTLKGWTFLFCFR